MNKRFWLNLLVLATLLAAPWSKVQAAPSAQSNLLANGGFETPGGGTGAANWTPWWTETPKPADGSYNYAYKPSWNLESLSAGASAAFIYSGNSAQRIWNNWDPWIAGVKQIVTAPAGARVRLTAYGKAWASANNWPSPSDPSAGMSIKVGIEPSGNDNQFANTVAWSGSVSPHDTWQSVSVEATVGSSGKVAVFLSASYWGSSRLFLVAVFDEASLVAVTGGPANTAAPGPTSVPQPTSPPLLTPFLTPTPGPDGNIIYVVQPGDTLWRISAITGIPIDQIKAMNGMTSDILSVGQRLTISQPAHAAPTNTPVPAVDSSAATATSAAAAGGGTQVASLGAATVCAMMFQDVNGNGRRDTNEGLVAGGQFTVVNTATGAPVQAYTTDGINEPHCFEGLTVGAYTVSSAAPAGYNATTTSTAVLQLEAGSLSNLEFGAQPSGSGGSDGVGSLSSNARLRTALFGAAGIMFLLLAAGVAGFLVLRRPR